MRGYPVSERAWMPRKRGWPVAVISVVLACSPATQLAGPRGATVVPVRRHLVPIDRATWQVRAAFDSAARAGDATRMGAVFAENAVLISAGGDSIRGRDAITRSAPPRRSRLASRSGGKVPWNCAVAPLASACRTPLTSAMRA
jgi:hypothetical protein